MKHQFLGWVLAVGLITVLVGFSYVAAHQGLRQGANDPQIQLAEDAVAALAAGGQVKDVIPATNVDIGKSLALYVIVYDADGNVVGSSGTLNGVAPKVPAGVLAFAKTHSIDKITWQPAPQVRSAIVVKYYQGKNTGYVVAGRSLRVVEEREDMVTNAAILAWVAAVLLATVAVFIKQLF